MAKRKVLPEASIQVMAGILRSLEPTGEEAGFGEKRDRALDLLVGDGLAGSLEEQGWATTAELEKAYFLEEGLDLYKEDSPSALGITPAGTIYDAYAGAGGDRGEEVMAWVRGDADPLYCSGDPWILSVACGARPRSCVPPSGVL